MTPDDPDTRDHELLDRYRRAGAAEDARPSEATRTAILAEARRVAAEQARPESLKPFDSRQGAANHSRWRLAAFGTLGVTVFAALLMVPFYRSGPPPTAATNSHSESMSVTSTTGRVAPSVEVNLYAPLALPAAPADDASNPVAPSQGTVARLAPAPAARAESRVSIESRASDKSRKAAGDALAEAAVTQQSARRAAAPAAVDGLRGPQEKLADARNAAPAPLLQAVQAGDADQVTRLLDQGASTRVSDDAGRSALFLAVIQRRADLVRVLLARGADPSVADRVGQTPLEWARQQRFDDMVVLLSPPLATH